MAYLLIVCVHAQSLTGPTLCNPMNCNLQASLSMGFSRQEYWSGLPFPPPGDLPDPGIQPSSPVSPALAGRLFTTEPPGKPGFNGTHAGFQFQYWSTLHAYKDLVNTQVLLIEPARPLLTLLVSN